MALRHTHRDAMRGLPPFIDLQQDERHASRQLVLLTRTGRVVKEVVARRLIERVGCALALLATLLVACATSGSVAWDPRLRGDAVVLLGEVHDNANQHPLRLATLQRAFASGWRPAIAMEQLDRDRQADIDRARRERPGDAAYLIALAAPRPWRGRLELGLYRPFVELALRYDVPLIAANLSNADTSKIVRGGYDAVFDAAEIAALGLDVTVAADLQSAQEREIDAGHCHAMPPAMWPRMARAQFARDAVMADVLRRAPAREASSCWRATVMSGATSACRVGSAASRSRVRRRLPRDRRRDDAGHGVRRRRADRCSRTRRSLCPIQSPVIAISASAMNSAGNA